MKNVGLGFPVLWLICQIMTHFWRPNTPWESEGFGLLYVIDELVVFPLPPPICARGERGQHVPPPWKAWQRKNNKRCMKRCLLFICIYFICGNYELSLYLSINGKKESEIRWKNEVHEYNVKVYIKEEWREKWEGNGNVKMIKEIREE